MGIDNALERTANSLRFKSVGIRVQKNAVRLLDTGPVELDTFFHAEVSSANYLILAESNTGEKETLQVNVVAGISADRLTYQAKLAVYGRVNFGTDLVEIEATVDSSRVILRASPLVAATVQVKIFPTYMETIYGD